MALRGDLLLIAPLEVSFQPEADLPQALVEVGGMRKVAEGERRLRLAVLEDALACLKRHALAKNHHRRRLFQEAETWIMETGEGSAFSFESVCEVLGIDADYLRSGLREWCDQRCERSNAPPASVEERRRRGVAVAPRPQSAAADVLERCLQGLRCAAYEGTTPRG